jgi:hypothetical protein
MEPNSDKDRQPMPVERLNPLMDRRSLFYWSWEYSKQLESGQDYHALPNVIAINIVNFEFLPAKGFHTCFHLWEDTERDLLFDRCLGDSLCGYGQVPAIGGKGHTERSPTPMASIF